MTSITITDPRPVVQTPVIRRRWSISALANKAVIHPQDNA